jgi:hypothetical protein
MYVNILEKQICCQMLVFLYIICAEGPEVRMRALEKALAVFFLVMGISILSVWTMLLVSGDVIVGSAGLFAFVFHWVSELFLAVLSIVLSIALFSKREWARTVCFFNLGMSVSSTFNAVYHYTYKDPALPLAAFTGMFFIISIILLVLGFKRFGFKDSLLQFGLFNMGLLAYLLLNLAGLQRQQGEWAFFTILVYLIGMALFFVFRLAGLNKKTA